MTPQSPTQTPPRPDRERLLRRLRAAEQRADVLLDGLGATAELLQHAEELLGRAGVAALLPVIAVEGEGEALAVAREILATLKGWQILAGRLGEARAALPALQAAAAKGTRAEVAAALRPLVEALGGVP